jgi:hypothetical protein
MTNKTKTIIAVVGIGLVAYYVWMRKKQGKSMMPFGKSSSFSGDENFFNLQGGVQGGTTTTSKGCQLYAGDGVVVGTILDGTRIVVRSDNGTTLVCPRSRTETGLPIKN